MSRERSSRTVVLRWVLAASALLTPCLVLLARSSSGMDAGPPSSQVAAPWRIGERDAVNSLYFLLRFHGRAVSYGQVVSALEGGKRRSTIGQVQAAAQLLGLRCGVYRCGAAELTKLDSPAIVHVEPWGVQSGGFSVLLSTYDPANVEGGVLVLDGGLATIRYFPLDVFRREWSGHILIAKLSTAEGGLGTLPVAVLAVATLLGLGFLASWLNRSSVVLQAADSPASVEGEPHGP
jgi:Peptidase C39 family